LLFIPRRTAEEIKATGQPIAASVENFAHAPYDGG